MSKIIILKRKHLLLGAAVLLMLLGGLAFQWVRSHQAAPVDGQAEGLRIIHMVTGEFKTTLADGTSLESYRWDPGTIFVEKGERVNLVIYGVNGESHPFYIEGTSIKGEVKKGKETSVIFQAPKEGVYRLICLTHPDKNHDGPMIGYIVVD
jgi:plastocyanin